MPKFTLYNDKTSVESDILHHMCYITRNILFRQDKAISARLVLIIHSNLKLDKKYQNELQNDIDSLIHYWLY